MSIYTLHRQARQLDKMFCGNGRKYSTGDVLFSAQGKRIVLGQYIAEGGEGSVFAVHLPSEATLIAKLYHPAQRMRWREQKLRLMCSRPIRSPCVAWPREILYDAAFCRRADAPGARCSARGFRVSWGAADEPVPLMDPLRSDQAVPELVGIRPCAAPLRCDPWGSSFRQCDGVR